MAWWQWALTIYAVGIPIGGFVNVGLLLGSGGYISYWPAIVRNAFLWPVMVPFLIGMYLESREN